MVVPTVVLQAPPRSFPPPSETGGSGPGLFPHFLLARWGVCFLPGVGIGWMGMDGWEFYFVIKMSLELCWELIFKAKLWSWGSFLPRAETGVYFFLVSVVKPSTSCGCGSGQTQLAVRVGPTVGLGRRA